MPCPRCGSDDIHHISLDQCNGCNGVFGQRSVDNPEIEIRTFVRKLSVYSRHARVLYALLEASGPLRFTDLLNYLDMSRSFLSNCLRDLMVDGLIRMVGKKYQAFCPTWMKEAVIQ